MPNPIEYFDADVSTKMIELGWANSNPAITFSFDYNLLYDTTSKLVFPNIILGTDTNIPVDTFCDKNNVVTFIKGINKINDNIYKYYGFLSSFPNKTDINLVFSQFTKITDQANDNLECYRNPSLTMYRTIV